MDAETCGKHDEMTYRIDEIINVICNWIEDNKCQTKLVSLTLSFGRNKGIETPELLFGVVTAEDIEYWKEKEDFFDYIWNQAECSHSELEPKAINKNFNFDVQRPRPYYINLLLQDKQKIKSRLYQRAGLDVFVYVHDLEDHDIGAIIDQNFDNNEMQSLKDAGLWN
ncbi:MAG: hypothetical protein ABJN69_08095 [Hellea sp.]